MSARGRSLRTLLVLLLFVYAAAASFNLVSQCRAVSGRATGCRCNTETVHADRGELQDGSGLLDYATGRARGHEVPTQGNLFSGSTRGPRNL